MDQKEPDVKIFDECPGCGATERFVADQYEKAGYDNPRMYGLNCRPVLQKDGTLATRIIGLPIFTGPVIDDETMRTSLVGHRFPLFAAPVDACGKCGMIYTIEQQILEGMKLQDAPMQMGPPGRPQVRRQAQPNIQDLLKGPYS